jgi:hypothetical protein
MYELYDPCTVMFFYRCVLLPLLKDYVSDVCHIPSCRNKHIMIDLGTGNNNKMFVILFSPQLLVAELHNHQ